MTAETRRQLRRVSRSLAEAILTIGYLPDSEETILADAIDAFQAPGVNDIALLMRAIDSITREPAKVAAR